MADTSHPTRFRHAVLAAAVAFIAPAGLPAIRGVGQGIAARVLRYLDDRRIKLDPGLWG